MQRLYLQIYLSFVAILLVFGVLLAIAWWLGPSDREDHFPFEATADLLGEVLPPPTDSVASLQASIDRLGERFRVDVTLRGADGALLASYGDPLLAPKPAARAWNTFTRQVVRLYSVTVDFSGSISTPSLRDSTKEGVAATYSALRSSGGSRRRSSKSPSSKILKSSNQNRVLSVWPSAARSSLSVPRGALCGAWYVQDIPQIPLPHEPKSLS